MVKSKLVKSRKWLRRECGRCRQGAVEYLPGKGTVPASRDKTSQIRVGGEQSHRRAFRVGHAGEYVGGERREAVPVCLVRGCACFLVPGRAGDSVIRG